jgi:hypothetical protein
MAVEPLRVIQRTEEDRRWLLVESWPRETEIPDEIVAQADPKAFAVDGDTLTITVSNGRAVYHLEPHDLLRVARRAYLVSSRISEPER